MTREKYKNEWRNLEAGSPVFGGGGLYVYLTRVQLRLLYFKVSMTICLKKLKHRLLESTH